MRSGIHTVFALDRNENLASQFNFTYRYINVVLSINKPHFDNNLGQIYPTELEIKETMESNISAEFSPIVQKVRSAAQFPLQQT